MACLLIASGTVLLNPHHEIGATLGAVCERHDREGQGRRGTKNEVMQFSA
jgi:hypothetical protein